MMKDHFFRKNIIHLLQIVSLYKWFLFLTTHQLMYLVTVWGQRNHPSVMEPNRLQGGTHGPQNGVVCQIFCLYFYTLQIERMHMGFWKSKPKWSAEISHPTVCWHAMAHMCKLNHSCQKVNGDPEKNNNIELVVQTAKCTFELEESFL